jgi:predicted RNA-binding Zn-ribbon protein involved in translation (DUF1610 family)
MIHFHCPECGTAAVYADAQAGERHKCAKCGTTSLLPWPDNPDAKPLQKPKAKKKKSPAQSATLVDGTIRFGCPLCDGKVIVDSSMGTKEIPCPHCAGTIVVPSAFVPPREPSPLDEFMAAIGWLLLIGFLILIGLAIWLVVKHG